jgi:hypothetical protein
LVHEEDHGTGLDAAGVGESRLLEKGEDGFLF